MVKKPDLEITNQTRFIQYTIKNRTFPFPGIVSFYQNLRLENILAIGLYFNELAIGTQIVFL
jgi:hypothetical protein